MTKPRLGIGKLLAQTGRSAVALALPILALCAFAALLQTTLGAAISTFLQPQASRLALIANWLVLIATQGLALSLVVIPLCQATAAREQGRKPQFTRTLPNLPRLILPLVAVWLLYSAASLPAMILPATLYQTMSGAIFMALLQAALLIAMYVLDRACFAGIPRAIRLTQGYRLAILAICVIAFILMALGAATLVGVFGALTPPWVYLFLSSAFFGLLAILSTHTYLRLRQIKEGAPAQDLADIFA